VALTPSLVRVASARIVPMDDDIWDFLGYVEYDED
jgi:hypothetical protein